MIFWNLFFTFSKIGLFNFGGGYAMLSFIQSEVVAKNQWMTEQEFTDIVAISQMTPGPIGINCATYVGYTSVMNDATLQASCSPEVMAVLAVAGSVLATLSVVWLPFIVMILVSKLILRHKDSIVMASIFRVLRPAIIGLIAAAALMLMTEANFSSPKESALQFGVSVAIFAVVFWGSKRYHWNPIYAILSCGAVGFLIYGLPLLAAA
jgi:chromate transporter